MGKLLGRKKAPKVDIEKRNANAMEAIREHDKAFSAKDFYNVVDKRMTVILLSESIDQVNTYATCDLSPFLGKYGTIIDCEITNKDITGFYVKEDLQHIQVVVDSVIKIKRKIGKPDDKSVKAIMHLTKPSKPKPSDEWLVAGLMIK